MRILIVSDTYPPEINGVARSLHRLMSELLHRHRIHLIRPRPRPPMREERHAAMTEMLVRGAPIPFYPDLQVGLASGRRIHGAIERFAPHAIHVATEGWLGWAALSAARSLEIPVSTDFRTNFHLYSAQYAFRFAPPMVLRYLRSFHNRADVTTVPTAALAAVLASRGFERLTVLGRGVDADAFSPRFRSERLRALWGVGTCDPVVLYVGRLAREKNLSLLVQAFAAMRHANPRARLVVAGDGPQHAWLRGRIPDALMLGWRHGMALSTTYASCDMFLFPSRTETFGNVTLEAAASALPIVAFDYGAAHEHLQSGISASLAPLGDATAYIAQAVALVRDADTRAAFGRAARVAAERATWAQIGLKFESLLRAGTVAASSQLKRH